MISGQTGPLGVHRGWPRGWAGRGTELLAEHTPRHSSKNKRVSGCIFRLEIYSAWKTCGLSFLQMSQDRNFEHPQSQHSLLPLGSVSTRPALWGWAWLPLPMEPKLVGCPPTPQSCGTSLSTHRHPHTGRRPVLFPRDPAGDTVSFPGSCPTYSCYSAHPALPCLSGHCPLWPASSLSVLLLLTQTYPLFLPSWECF